MKGNTFSPAVAISSQAQDDYTPFGAIWFSSDPAACDLVTGHALPKDASILILELGEQAVDPTTQTKMSVPVTAGTFPIAKDPGTSGDQGAAVTYLEDDDACKPQTVSMSVSGTVVLDDVANGAFSGKVDVKLDTDDTISIEFHASSCPGLGEYYQWGGDPACGATSGGS